MPECAFCESTDLTKEHFFAAWIDEKFSLSWTTTYMDKNYQSYTHDSVELDFQAKVVCGRCNHTWMNDIEFQHARPVITPMMLGQIGIPVNNAMAQSMALFAFKMAVVADMSRRRELPFFPRRMRHAFRISRYIPQGVFMWMAGCVLHDTKIALDVGYLQNSGPTSYPFEHYVITCAIGCFVFQLIALKPVPPYRFRANRAFDSLAVPFWPKLVEGFVWPARRGLMSFEELKQFHHRWDTIERV
jgi:hypothetical protein